MEPLLNLLSNATSAAVFAMFALMLWRRTDRTITFYESLLHDWHERIAATLDRIDERTSRCPQNPNPRP